MADPIEALSSSPILQWALVAGTFVAGAIAVWRGLASKPAARRSSDSVLDWFVIDGPIGKVIELLDKQVELLHGIYNETKRAREERKDQAAENIRKQDEMIREIRDRQPDRRNRPQR